MREGQRLARAGAPCVPANGARGAATIAWQLTMHLWRCCAPDKLVMPCRIEDKQDGLQQRRPPTAPCEAARPPPTHPPTGRACTVAVAVPVLAVLCPCSTGGPPTQSRTRCRASTGGTQRRRARSTTCSRWPGRSSSGRVSRVTHATLQSCHVLVGQAHALGPGPRMHISPFPPHAHAHAHAARLSAG